MAVLAVTTVLAASGVAWGAGSAVDSSFGEGGFALSRGQGHSRIFGDVTEDAGGRYVAAGFESLGGADGDVLVSRYDHGGHPDRSFGDGGSAVVHLGWPSGAGRVATMRDGSVVVAGTDRASQAPWGTTIVKLTSAGRLDTTFGSRGVVHITPAGAKTTVNVLGLAVDSSILVGTTTFSIDTGVQTTELRRFDLSGRPVAGFGNAGVVRVDVKSPNDMRAVPGGVVFLIGSVAGLTVARTDATGALDRSFGKGGFAVLPSQLLGGSEARLASPEADGSIAVSATTLTGELQVVRFHTRDGSVVTGFGAGGVRTLAPAPGDIVVDGAFLGVHGGAPLVALTEVADPTKEVPQSRVRRLLADGRRDDGFGQHGSTELGGPAVSSFHSGGFGLVDDTRAIAGGFAVAAGTQSLVGALGGVALAQPSAGPPKAPVDRIADDDAIASAIATSEDLFRSVDASSDGRLAAHAVVLASSASFVDALVGGPLATARGAPLLLTGGDGVDERVVAELQRILGSAGEVFLVGGTAALSGQIDRDLGALGYHVTRYGGVHRFATARRVADAVAPGYANAIVLANGRAYPDALTAGVLASHLHGPLLLTDGGLLPSATQAYLAHGAYAVYGVGRDAATADPGAIALAGADAYATALVVAKRLYVTPACVGIASGEAFADALSGAAHAGMQHCPVVLSRSSTLGADADAYLRGAARFLDRVVLYGGTAVLGPAVQSGATAAVQ